MTGAERRSADLIAAETTTVLPWELVRGALADNRLYWLATVHPDGAFDAPRLTHGRPAAVLPIQDHARDRPYATLMLDDQVTFVHIVQSEHDPSPILAVKAFGEFQAGIMDRCDQPPTQQAFTEIGSYRFLVG